MPRKIDFCPMGIEKLRLELKKSTVLEAVC